MSFDDPWILDELIEAYKQHQRRTRGLRERTLHGYEQHVRRFVRAALGEDPVELSQLSAAQVVEFVASLAGQWSPASMKQVRTALRSFLRYLRLQGACDERLEAAIPKVARWRLSTLPASLSDAQLGAVLASLEVDTPCGPRDRAIVRCLAMLGLRPGEVAELCLDDIDWRAGAVEVGERKNRRGAVLPLPHEAGEAIASYVCQSRPATDERRVFVQHLGTRRGQPLSGNAISEVAVRALRRAEVEAPITGGSGYRGLFSFADPRRPCRDECPQGRCP